MTLRERLGLGLARRILGRLSLAGRVQELEAQRDEAERGVNHLTAALDKAEAELVEERRKLAAAEKGEKDQRTMWQQAEADAESLREQLAAAEERARDRSAQQAQALLVREEELAAALELAGRRTWPDLLDAVRRAVVATSPRRDIRGKA